MGLGALIIQARMKLTNRETVETIKENPYMQYFIGRSGFEHKAPFHPSMMTHFRKRLGPALGRPPKAGYRSDQKQMARQDAADRNGIEGKFGGGKRKYGLGLIRAKLVESSESVIYLQLLVMNLERRLRLPFFSCFSILYFDAWYSILQPKDSSASPS